MRQAQQWRAQDLRFRPPARRSSRVASGAPAALTVKWRSPLFFALASSPPPPQQSPRQSCGAALAACAQQPARVQKERAALSAATQQVGAAAAARKDAGRAYATLAQRLRARALARSLSVCARLARRAQLPGVAAAAHLAARRRRESRALRRNAPLASAGAGRALDRVNSPPPSELTNSSTLQEFPHSRRMTPNNNSSSSSPSSSWRPPVERRIAAPRRACADSGKTFDARCVPRRQLRGGSGGQSASST